MQLLKTDKTVLTDVEILQYIADYELNQVPEFDKLWKYYEGKNVKISTRKAPDPNNPDNIIPIPYGRKIVTTFTGYAYRPKYITYKIDEELEEDYLSNLLYSFKINNEHIKTNRAGRNTAIFGVAYELMYIDGLLTNDEKIPIKAEPKFFSVDPREMILLYDYSSEPKKIIAIRFYRITNDYYKVEVYYPTKVLLYDRKRTVDGKWSLSFVSEAPNYFGEIPVVPFYFGDEMNGVITPVIPLIDSYDVLISDSMNEFDRFAHAYLIMKKFGLTDPTKKKDEGAISRTLQMLKRSRIFEYLDEKADIHFLTKDIPTNFIDYMSKFVQNQIHIQSHVPDFTGDRMAGASGIAIQRLLFDFENVVSSAEADFDIGLMERIRLLTIIYERIGLAIGDPGNVVISHKRNVPLNLMEFAQTAVTMKQAGFSSYLVADIMPDDIVPNVEGELERQREEQEAMYPDVSMIPSEEAPPEESESPEEMNEEGV